MAAQPGMGTRPGHAAVGLGYSRRMSSARAAPAADLFLRGGGAMGETIRAFDWVGTPLGAPAHWPSSLKSAVSCC